MAYLNMARIAGEKGDLSEKQKYYSKLKELLRDGPISILVGMFSLGMGLAESIRGNYRAAQGLLEDALNVFRAARSTYFQLVVSSELGHVARHAGDIDQARRTYPETIRGWRDLGNRSAIAHQLECFAFIALAQEDPQHAIKLLGSAEALRDKIGAQMTDYEQIEYDEEVARLRLLLNGSDFTALWAEGRTLTMEQAIEVALS
jgi:tetratricopeptide (TPR) repeat protein